MPIFINLWFQSVYSYYFCLAQNFTQPLVCLCEHHEQRIKNPQKEKRKQWKENLMRCEN